ncbi:MAG TPA: amidohydrolase family protein [Firmicutes bacterium]|nr:amidohydrolase family protein [Bacillota bacterium]
MDYRDRDYKDYNAVYDAFSEISAGLETEAMRITDTHEHLRPDDFYQDIDLEKVLKNSYVDWCGVELKGSDRAARAQFLEKVRVNSYFRWLLRSLQQLYGFEGELTADNWDEISARIRAAHADPGWKFKVLTEKCRIGRAILDAYWDPGNDNGHPEIFSPTFRINMFLFGYSRKAVDHNGNSPFRLAERYGFGISDFESYLAFIDFAIRKAREGGAVALKSALAYDRGLHFDYVARDRAAKVFEMDDTSISPCDEKAFGDYIFHFICEKAAEYGLPLQCHTGLGKIWGSNPMNLVPVIERHPETRFVLFHGGYPWFHECGGLAHNYKNVYLDLVWLPLISPSAARMALSEWLEVAQTIDRISWGGDTWTVEECFGAVIAAKHVIAQALADKVVDGYFDLEIAIDVAKRILRVNAEELYRLA